MASHKNFMDRHVDVTPHLNYKPEHSPYTVISRELEIVYRYVDKQKRNDDSMVFQSTNKRVKHAAPKGYSYNRVTGKERAATIYLRKKYGFGIHTISLIIGRSTRTIKRILHNQIVNIIDRFNDNRKRWAGKRKRFSNGRQVKIVSKYGGILHLKELVNRIESWFSGTYETLEQALGEEPP